MRVNQRELKRPVRRSIAGDCGVISPVADAIAKRGVARRPRWLLIGAVPIALSLTLSFTSGAAYAAEFRAWPGNGGTASQPELRLRDLQGRIRGLGEFKGKVVLVNFWASWCEPCRNEMGELDTLYKRYRPRGFEIVAVNLGESDTHIRSFLKAWLPGAAFAVLQDRDSKAYKAWSVRALPASFLVDRAGVIRWQALGAIDVDDGSTVKRIEQLLR